MILNALFQKIVFHIKQHPDEFGSRFLIECATRMDKSIEDYVLSLPVSAITQVRDYVPQAFPRKLRKMPLQVKKNNLGAWRVDPVVPAKNFSKQLNR